MLERIPARMGEIRYELKPMLRLPDSSAVCADPPAVIQPNRAF